MIVVVVFVSLAHAQIEVAHLSSKGFSANGFGAFLNFTVPVAEYGAISAEGAFYYFKKGNDHLAMVPFLLGYRYMLQDPESGVYVEPNAGYNIGASDIQKYDENGNIMFDPATGAILERQVKGFTAGLGAGYIFSGTFALNLGLRYQRVFVPADPSLNLFSLRISYPLSFRRRE